jgi:phosphoserine phosphatase RsbU/P
MDEPLLLPPKQAPRKPFWRRWKWIGLIVFAAALLLERWLPAPLVVLGWLWGLAALMNMVFLGLRWLKKRFFWRVRNRIIGSFVFVGLIPLALMCALVAAAGYMLFGQLSGDLLVRTLGEYQGQLGAINGRLTQQVRSAEPLSIQQVVGTVLREHADSFPHLAVRVVRRAGNGPYQETWQYDPAAILPPGSDYPAEKWASPDGVFEGILVASGRAWMASLRPLPAVPSYSLELSAPIDARLAARLANEKSIYASYEGVGTTHVQESRRGMQITTNMDADPAESASPVPRSADPDADRLRAEVEKLRDSDTRPKSAWFALLEGRDFQTGKTRGAALALLRVPIPILYNAYLGGQSPVGQAAYKFIYVLATLFLTAVVVSAVIGAAISRRVTKSVDDLYRGILALQKGDLESRIPERKEDQLGLLAHSFNQMTGAVKRLLEEVSEKKRLEQELEIAREVQATLFPKQLPRPRGLVVYGGCEPARVVSGDYYDFIVEDESRLHIVVGDISGKGISAALMMANLQAAMRSQLLQLRQGNSEGFGARLATVMSQLNGQIYANSPSEKYVTLFAARYDAETRQLCYCNAGHLPPVVVADGGMRRLETGGTVLGLFESVNYQTATVDLAPGSVLAFFTDGVTEAVNEQDEEFGEERLFRILKDCAVLSPEMVYRNVTGQIRDWQGSLKQHDDITLILASVG